MMGADNCTDCTRLHFFVKLVLIQIKMTIKCSSCLTNIFIYYKYCFVHNLQHSIQVTGLQSVSVAAILTQTCVCVGVMCCGVIHH